MILESLPESFNHYKNNYYMIGKELTFTQLIFELESTKESLEKLDYVHHAVSSNKLKGKPKDGYKNKRKAKILITKTTAMKKFKGRFFKFG